MPVAAQQYAEIVEPSDDTLQFDAVDQENREWNLVFTDKIEKSVLQVLGRSAPISGYPILFLARWPAHIAN